MASTIILYAQGSREIFQTEKFLDRPGFEPIRHQHGSPLAQLVKALAIKQDNAGGGWVRIPAELGIFRVGKFLDFPGYRV